MSIFKRSTDCSSETVNSTHSVWYTAVQFQSGNRVLLVQVATKNKSSQVTAKQVVEFQDSDGDAIKFQLRDGALVEFVNNRLELDSISSLEWDPERRRLRDSGRCRTACHLAH